MKDKVFGEIAYANNAWRKKMGLSLDGHDYEIELRIEDNNKEGILDIQREAFNAYQKNLDRYTQEVPNILVDHYKWYFEAIRKAVTLDEDTQKETITTQTMLDIVMATYLCITRNGEFGWVFACSWNNGFAVLLSEGKIKNSDYVAMVRNAPPPTPTGVAYHRHGCKPVLGMGAVMEPQWGDT